MSELTNPGTVDTSGGAPPPSGGDDAGPVGTDTGGALPSIRDLLARALGPADGEADPHTPPPATRDGDVDGGPPERARRSQKGAKKPAAEPPPEADPPADDAAGGEDEPPADLASVPDEADPADDSPAEPEPPTTKGKGKPDPKADDAEARKQKGRDDAGYRAWLNRKNKRIEEGREQLNRQTADAGKRERSLQDREQALAAKEQEAAEGRELAELARTDPIAFLERRGLKPHDAVQALLERERAGTGAKPDERPREKPAEPAKKEKSPEVEALEKQVAELKEAELTRQRHQTAREFVEGVAEGDHPHLKAFFEVEAVDPEARALQIGGCYNKFQERYGRAPKGDGELRAYMNAQAKRWFEGQRTRYEGMKRIYEPGETRPQDARKGDGATAAPGPKGRTADGKPVKPAPRGQNAEGRTAANKPSLTNRASTDAGAPPTRDPAARGLVAKAIASALTTAGSE